MIAFQRTISFNGDTNVLASVQVTLAVPRLAFQVADDVVTGQNSAAEVTTRAPPPSVTRQHIRMRNG